MDVHLHDETSLCVPAIKLTGQVDAVHVLVFTGI